ncbi:MAG: hypothetical protein PHN84_14200 [Desulfuromonadaceae bacterium]|nr:hypothetical protein [Desulfuromonadaceae bacterium]
MQESASFWADIKDLSDKLADSPDSLCFARLSEVYLKVGLIDDALHVARQGVMLHSRFISGQRSLALACKAKGLHEEAVLALQIVTEGVPEDTASQKLLGRLLVDAGNQAAASAVFMAALEFAPDDVECRIEFESLQRPEVANDVYSASEDEIIEELDILEELEVFDEEEFNVEEESIVETEFQNTQLQSVAASNTHHDPLSTSTLAELYVSQGFIKKALEIYRTILADNPGAADISERVAQLEVMDSVTPLTAVETDEVTFTESEEPDDTTEYEYAENSTVVETSIVADASDEFIIPEEPLETVPPLQFEPLPVFESQQINIEPLSQQSAADLVPKQGISDNALTTLEGWLENIRRVKSCR